VIAQSEGPFGIEIGQVVQVLVVFFLFVLPALRGIVQAQKKQRERREGRGDAREESLARTPQQSDREEWEPRARAEARERAVPEPVDLESLFPELVEEEPAPPAPEPVPVPVAVRRERAADRRVASSDFAGLEREAPAKLQQLTTDLDAPAVTDFTSLDDELGARPTRSAARRTHALAAGVDWRRAIVLAEVLGPPVSQRAGSAWPGPPLGLT
jgi:hypothetical protein